MPSIKISFIDSFSSLSSIFTTRCSSSFVTFKTISSLFKIYPSGSFISAILYFPVTPFSSDVWYKLFNVIVPFSFVTIVSYSLSSSLLNVNWAPWSFTISESVVFSSSFSTFTISKLYLSIGVFSTITFTCISSFSSLSTTLSISIFPSFEYE